MTGPLDILFVGTLPPHPGGSAVANWRFLVGLARRGHRVRALAPITPGAPDAEALEGSHPDVAVARYPVTRFEIVQNLDPDDPLRRWEIGQIVERLPGLIAGRRPDLLLIGRENLLWAAAEIAGAPDVPCVLIIHGPALVRALTGEWPEGLARRLREQLGRFALRVTSARHWAACLEGAGAGPVTVIPNAVDRQRFSPGPRDPALVRELGLPTDTLTIVHASNLKSAKRPLDIVESAAAALAAEPGIVYVIVGDGPMRGELERACQERGLAGQFRFTGWIETPRMPSYVRLADIVLMPSAWEAQALVYLETLACGRVLLASDIPAAREVVVDGETGLLFRAGDIAALTEKTLLAARSAPLREAIGRRARESVRVHGLDDVARAFAAVLQEVVRGDRAGSSLVT